VPFEDVAQMVKEESSRRTLGMESHELVCITIVKSPDQPADQERVTPHADFFGAKEPEPESEPVPEAIAPRKRVEPAPESKPDALGIDAPEVCLFCWGAKVLGTGSEEGPVVPCFNCCPVPVPVPALADAP
jgi:hypothetical protein